MVVKKRKSKRITTKRREKIRKKVREHDKKKRREGKLLEKRRTKVPPSVLRTEEENLTFEMIKRGVEERQKAYKEKIAEDKTVDVSFKNNMKHINNLIERSDVIIQILDCRDPAGSRNYEIEKRIGLAGKKLVLILNKSDLVPKEIARGWLEVLRKEYPAYIHSKEYLREEVLSILKNYSRNESGNNGEIMVGVVGYPNVGKSTFINLMKRSKSCNVGDKAGITKDLQFISVDGNIKIIDSPGVLFSREVRLMDVLRGSVDLDRLDLIKYVNDAVSIIKKEDLLLLYNIPAFENGGEFLTLLGNRYKMVKRGGAINLEGAGKRFFKDIYSGKILFYCYPGNDENRNDGYLRGLLGDGNGEEEKTVGGTVFKVNPKFLVRHSD
jgi:nuclear GTP-binding protein